MRSVLRTLYAGKALKSHLYIVMANILEFSIARGVTLAHMAIFMENPQFWFPRQFLTKPFISVVALPIPNSLYIRKPLVLSTSSTWASIHGLTLPLIEASYYCFIVVCFWACFIFCIDLFSNYCKLATTFLPNHPTFFFLPQIDTGHHTLLCMQPFRKYTMGCLDRLESLKHRFSRLRPAWTRSSPPPRTRGLQIVSIPSRGRWLWKIEIDLPQGYPENFRKLTDDAFTSSVFTGTEQ